MSREIILEREHFNLIRELMRNIVSFSEPAKELPSNYEKTPFEIVFDDGTKSPVNIVFSNDERDAIIEILTEMDGCVDPPKIKISGKDFWNGE